MLIALLASLLGLAGLVWSADVFVAGSASLALRFGLSRMTVGLTLVAFGTSAPEILVSGAAALAGSPGLAVGNALGSNIANMGLVLGITVLLMPIPILRHTRAQDMPLYLGVAALAGLLLSDYRLAVHDGLILLGTCALILYLLWRYRSDSLTEEADLDQEELDPGRALRFFLGGLVVLLISARLLVWGATHLAMAAGISESVIGLTLVALGTSLPELATSVTAARKGHADLAVGNVIGSNVLNLLTVLPLPGLLAAGVVEASLVNRDYLVMLGISVLTALLLAGTGRRPLGRLAGLALVLSYGGYIGLLAVETL